MLGRLGRGDRAASDDLLIIIRCVHCGVLAFQSENWTLEESETQPGCDDRDYGFDGKEADRSLLRVRMQQMRGEREQRDMQEIHPIADFSYALER